MKHYEELSGSERRIRILEILREKGEVTVAELAETFGVTVMTIRRDLHFYEDQGILEMHYGGAKLREAAPPFAVFSKRGELHHAEKKEIGDIPGYLQKIIDDYNTGAPAYKKVYRLKVRETEFEKTPSKKIKRY